MTLLPQLVTVSLSVSAADGVPNSVVGVISNDRLRRRTLLLVEDEPFVREATRGILERAGFEVLQAIDAQTAMLIYTAREHTIVLVMADMILPGHTGQQLGRKIQERSPATAVLITSGYTSLAEEIEDPALRTYFLAKPYSRRTLIEKIEKILAASALAHSAMQAG